MERIERSIYDLDPEDDGMFDFVYVGSLLLHLRDPVRALERVRSVCRGHLLLVDAIHLPLTLLHPRRPVATFDGIGRPWWWKPNLVALERLVRSAGFERVGRPLRLFMPRGAGQPWPSLRTGTPLSPDGRSALFAAWPGDPHAAVLARPAV